MGSPSPKVKVCCISSPREAELAIEHGAAALGLVSEMPSGPGVIDEATIAEIAVDVPSEVATFLLTALTEPEAIARQLERCRTNTVQLVDRLTPDALDRLGELVPHVARVQVIHVQGDDAVAEAETFAPHVEALLLDSGRPDAAVRELGGTGRTHDWDVSREIVSTVSSPVFLAGGLNPENVAGAIEAVRPTGLDLCSGIRTDGHLDEVKLARFMEVVGGVAPAADV